MKKKFQYLKMKWHESLGIRLSVFIMLTTIFLFAMTIGVCLYQVNEKTTWRTISTTGSQMDNALELIDKDLYGVEQTVKDFATNAKYYTSTKQGCYMFCEEILRCDSSIYAATLMFRPDYFSDMPAGHHLYAPAVAHKKGTDIYRSSNLVEASDDEFQYVKTDSNWIWTNRLDGGYWCEPYHDVYHTSDFLVTYSYPLHDSEGKIYCVICADVKLSLLSERLYRLRPTDHTSIMMLTKNSHFLVHPVKQFVEPKGDNLVSPSVADTINKGGVDTMIVSLYRNMLSGRKGIMTIDHPVSFTMCGKTDVIPDGYVLYSSVKSSGWSVAAVCPKADIDVESHRLVSRVLICALIGLILMAGALFIMVRKMVAPYKKFAAVDADIKTAARIQKSLITTVFPKRMDMNGKDMFASMIPAKRIGGDLYDYYLNDNKLTFVVGDVSGKGVPATFFMSSALTLFRVFSEKGFSPANIVEEINNSLSKGNETMMFVTIFVGQLDLGTGEMDYCNGGHNAPVIIHGSPSTESVQAKFNNCDKKAEYMPLQTNLPAGVMGDVPYVEEHLRLNNGDTLVIYTDGVTESEDKDCNFYSDAGLLEFLTVNDFTSASELCSSLIKDVRKHAGEAEQSDDITIMCIKF